MEPTHPLLRRGGTMTIANQQLLTISSGLPSKTLQELKKILDILVLGAFGEQTCVQATLVEDTGHTVLGLEFVPDIDSCTTVEIAIRLADTMLDVLGALARELGVEYRLSSLPSCRMLKLPGLSWHRLQLSFRKLISTPEARGCIELVRGSSGRRLRIATGRSLVGYSAGHSDWLCDAIIQRRATLGGEIVRIRSGHREMSFAMPRNISATTVSEGSVISTTPIVGRIPRRLLKIRRCQLSLLDLGVACAP